MKGTLRLLTDIFILAFGSTAARNEVFVQDHQERMERARKRVLEWRARHASANQDRPDQEDVGHLGYAYLESRRHQWRRQLWFKGRSLTVDHVIGQMRANKWDVETTAENFDVPVEAVVEALDYSERFPNVIQKDAAEERSRVLHALGLEEESSNLPHCPDASKTKPGGADPTSD